MLNIISKLIVAGSKLIVAIVAAGTVAMLVSVAFAYGMDDDYAKDHGLDRPGFVEWLSSGNKIIGK